MAPTRWCVLVALADLCDCEGPVRPERLADALNVSAGDAERCLGALADCELAVEVPESGAYRPTVTGRELLELDVDRPEDAVVAFHESV